jgi:hypothetical protein
MVKQKQKKITPVSLGEWKDLRVRETTAKDLQRLKIDLDLLTYDDVIRVMLNERLAK